MSDKHMSFKVLMLITTPKLAEKAQKLFANEKIPMVYSMNARGTATSEIMDMLGLGSIDKKIVTTTLPEQKANEILESLSQTLKFKKANSGIAFTVPLKGSSSFILHIMEKLNHDLEQEGRKEEDCVMADMKYSMIAAVVNRGYTTDVMEAAKAAGATGGSVIKSRRIIDEETVHLWGMGFQEEKEIVLIVAPNDKKVEIMSQIGKECGMHSEAKGYVLSFPIDNVVGLGENK